MFSDIVLSNDSPAAVTRIARDIERNSDIDRIRSEIKEAVTGEEYERAAELRDILKPLLADNTEGKDDV